MCLQGCIAPTRHPDTWWNLVTTLENSLAVSYKWSIYLPYDLGIPLLAVYVREMKTYVYTETYAWMIINVLFIV